MTRITHAQQRAAERYLANLDREDLRRLAAKAQDRDGEFIRRQRNGREEWLLRSERHGCLFRAIYDPQTEQIVTVLPQDNVLRMRDRRRTQLRPYRERDEDVAPQWAWEGDAPAAIEPGQCCNDVLAARLAEAFGRAAP